MKRVNYIVVLATEGFVVLLPPGRSLQGTKLCVTPDRLMAEAVLIACSQPTQSGMRYPIHKHPDDMKAFCDEVVKTYKSLKKDPGPIDTTQDPSGNIQP